MKWFGQQLLRIALLCITKKKIDEPTKIFYMDKTIIQIIKMWTQALNWFEYENFPTMKHIFSLDFYQSVETEQKEKTF